MSVLFLFFLAILVLNLTMWFFLSHYFLVKGFPKLKFKNLIAIFFALVITILIIYALYLH